MEPFAFVNDEFVPASRASLLISDLSIQRGYGIFDFFKTLGGEPIFLSEHLDRFFYSVERMRLHVGKTREELRTIIATLLARNAIPDSGVRIELTGGYSADGYTVTRPNLLITQSALTQPITGELGRGIRLMTYPHVRQMADIKTIDYLMAIWLQPLIREKGADDVLYHRDGVISECPRSNFFLVTAGDVLVTPSKDILMGITRMKLLSLASRQLAVEERDVTLAELRTAKEAFITSTTKHVLPVTHIDGVAVGTGEAGPVARRLNTALYEMVMGR